MSTPCVGPEFQLDTNGSLTVRSPRAAQWPDDPQAMTTTNGLLTDPAGGLWVPQTPMFGTGQQFRGVVSVNLSPGSPAYLPSGIAPSALVNPSAKQAATYHVQAEWEIYMTTHYGVWLELWGGFSWGSGTGIAGSTVLASACMSAQGKSSTAQTPSWHQVISRTFEITVPAGGTQALTMSWGANCVSAPAGTPTPESTVQQYRAGVTVMGVLAYPAPIA